VKDYTVPDITEWPEDDPRRKMSEFDESFLREQYNQWMPPEQPVLQELPGLNPMEEILTKEIAEVGGSALDIGCGNGKFLSSLAFSEHIGWGLGIDISDAMIANATESASNIAATSGAELTFARSSFEELGNKGFDIIIATEVLEHIYNLRAMIGKVRRILASGGIFVGTTPAGHTCDAIVHLHYFTSKSLGDLLSPFFRYVHVETVDATGEGENHLVFVCRHPREVLEVLNE
jgi:2-polyprenyl-3-methyl-5-hydroxy-6-metoxy-1,4-benzoquinol methylase